jgi:hypothetical protein
LISTIIPRSFTIKNARAKLLLAVNFPREKYQGSPEPRLTGKLEIVPNGSVASSRTKSNQFEPHFASFAAGPLKRERKDAKAQRRGENATSRA